MVRTNDSEYGRAYARLSNAPNTLVGGNFLLPDWLCFWLCREGFGRMKKKNQVVLILGGG